jgi:NADH dehydrogenase [ubiquinone] 1 alpha subcomplex assembly factor 3
MLVRSALVSACSRTPTVPFRGPLQPFSLSSTRRSQLENVLEGGAPQPVQVTKVSPTGIELADGLVITSSCIFLGGKVFLWRVPPTLWSGWEKERFEIFEVAVPKPGASSLRQPIARTYISWGMFTELLIFGTGESTVAPPTAIRRYLHELGIGMEIMDTVCAGRFLLHIG